MLCQSNACGLDVLTASSNVHLNLGLSLFHSYSYFVFLLKMNLITDFGLVQISFLHGKVIICSNYYNLHMGTCCCIRKSEQMNEAEYLASLALARVGERLEKSGSELQSDEFRDLDTRVWQLGELQTKVKNAPKAEEIVYAEYLKQKSFELLQKHDPRMLSPPMRDFL